MNFNSHKHRVAQPTVMKQVQQDLDRVPGQFSDYMNNQCTRFSEICKIYLEGMAVDDIRYMKPEDFINLVPEHQYRHKLLMTIMVRRYLYRSDDTINTVSPSASFGNCGCDCVTNIETSINTL